MIRWIASLALRLWNRNLTKLLSACKDRDLTTLEVWELFPGKSIGWVHTFIDSTKQYGYVDDRLEPGDNSRGYRMRRIVSITDLGRFAIENDRLNSPVPPPAPVSDNKYRSRPD